MLSLCVVSSLNDAITPVVSGLCVPLSQWPTQKPGVTVGVITYLTNAPLRVNNVDVVSRAFA